MWVQVYVGHTVSMIYIIYLWDNNIRVRKLLHLCKGRKAPFVVCTLMWRDNYSVWTFSTWHKLTNYSLFVKTKEIRDLEVIGPDVKIQTVGLILGHRLARSPAIGYTWDQAGTGPTLSTTRIYLIICIG